MKSRILVCGGRTYFDQHAVFKTLNQLRTFFANDFVLIQGGARGADDNAKSWAYAVGCPLIEMPAMWDVLGNKAGSIRNEWMLKYTQPDLVIAFPGGFGTADMIERAKAAGVDVYEVR